jgi:hypothetical protein
VVKIEKVCDDGAIHLSGVDLLDGTPILDIKPYLPSSDLIPNASAGWTGPLPERTLKVTFTSEALVHVEKYFGERAIVARSAMTEILELDPRPVFYRGTAETPNPYTDTYGFRFDDFNVVYRMIGTDAHVLSLQPWAEYQASLKK